ncbi:MAG: aldo/keto reductase [Actinomycetales bacterium]
MVIPTVPLAGSTPVDFPLLGLGTWPMTGRECADAVRSALETGYRLIDTAAQYGNEDGVGQGLAESDVPRADIVVTTKLAGRDQGNVRQALEASLTKLGLDYVDVYLIHWPNPMDEKYLPSFEQMLTAQQEGLIRVVGVSNFLPEHLDRLKAATGVFPAVNQIQFCPQVTRDDLRAFHDSNGIHTEGWRPFGVGLLDHPSVRAVAQETGRTPAQVLLRWQVQQGVSTIPKSGHPARQAANLEIFAFELSADQLGRLSALDEGVPDNYDPRTHSEY